MKKSKKIANEVWRMLPNECKEIMKEVKYSFIESVSADIESEYEFISLSDNNKEIRMPSPQEVVPFSLFLRKKKNVLDKTIREMKKVLAFRVGKTYNGKDSQGSVQFLGESEIGEFIDQYNLCFNEYEDEYYDEGGNPVGLTPDQVDSGVGEIDYDGEYNRVYTKEVEVDEDGVIYDELTSREHNAILWSEDWEHDEIKEELNITERA